MITYNTHPSLLFLSYDKDNAPEDLPFECTSIEVLDYLAGGTGFQEMFGIIANLNTLNHQPTHYWLNNKRFDFVEYDTNFRNNHFRKFLTDPMLNVQYGCICFKNGGQYVYLYLPPGKSELKGVQGAYFAAALFKENLFLGFEEAEIRQGFSIMPTGYYGGGMDIGGYLSFTAVCLSFFKDSKSKVHNSINGTKEDLWTKM